MYLTLAKPLWALLVVLHGLHLLDKDTPQPVISRHLLLLQHQVVLLSFEMVGSGVHGIRKLSYHVTISSISSNRKLSAVSSGH
ncbi:hypothetical protein OROMI_003184 [Orobanche minor]